MEAAIVSEFQKLGCENRRDRTVAFQVYLELCEVKKYWDVEYFYNSNLQKIYFSARKLKNGPQSIFIPISIFESPSFSDLENLFHLQSDPESQDLQIVLVNNDSTCVYYQITNNLIDPLVIENRKDDSYKRIDVGLRKHKKILEEAAKYGMSITIPNLQQEQPKSSESSREVDDTN